MSIELPRDAEGREIPLDTVALFNRVGNVYSIVRWTFTTDFDLSDGWSNKFVFDVVTNEGYAVGAAARHPLNGATYRIDYILDDFEGLAQKYVALAISKED